MSSNRLDSLPTCRDEVTVPWLNNIFNKFGHQIVSLEWVGNASNGVGLMSQLERIALKLDSGQELKVILKLLPGAGNPWREVTLSHGFAKRELGIYNMLFKEWEQFLNSRSVPAQFRFRYPKCYFAASNGESDNPGFEMIIILEDLVASGYEMWPGGYAKSLNFTEAKPCLRQIALFHATSLAFRHENPGIMETWPFLQGSKKDTEEVQNFLDPGFKLVKKLVLDCGKQAKEEKAAKEKVPEANQSGKEEEEQISLYLLPPDLLSTLEKLVTNGSRHMSAIYPYDYKFGALIHHDLHVNNFMFKKNDESNDSEAVLFDYQACQMSFPMKDLSFFLLQNCNESLLHVEFDNVIQYYHEVLQDALVAMGVGGKFPGYTVGKIKQEYEDRAYLSILHIIAGAEGWVDNSGCVTTARRFYNRLVLMFNDGMLSKETPGLT